MVFGLLVPFTDLIEGIEWLPIDPFHEFVFEIDVL
jgi:hypothetical protein